MIHFAIEVIKKEDLDNGTIIIEDRANKAKVTINIEGISKIDDSFSGVMDQAKAAIAQFKNK